MVRLLPSFSRLFYLRLIPLFPFRYLFQSSKFSRNMNIIFSTFILTILSEVYGHGRLMEPPARNAMWRYGYQNPVNYNDNELYCGGFVVHYQKNGGKCGVCGDNYIEKVPRKHEAGGIFGNGIIGRRYVVGQSITITADLTTNHYGWMEVKLCPNNDPNKIVTQDCLNRYPLKMVGTDTHRFVIPRESKKVETFTWTVQLPDSVSCSQCIIQWTYFAGNTWDKCSDGSEGVGCGNQETFINCADVEILSNAGFVGHVPELNPWLIYIRGNEYSAVTHPKEVLGPDGFRPLVVRSQLCIPIGIFKNVVGMDDWCRVNCLKYPPNCHPEMCKCVHECEAIGNFSMIENADIFCHQNCLKYPSYCPEERCKCM